MAFPCLWRKVAPQERSPAVQDACPGASPGYDATSILNSASLQDAAISPREITRMLNIQTEANGLWAVFGANPVTKIGKKMQLMCMLSITMVPISILLSLVGTIFCMRLNEWLKATEIRQTLRFSIEISELVDNLQKERDYSAIYVSSIGMDTKAYLVERYPLTDASIQSLTGWDASDDNDLEYFQSKENFQNYLNRHRYELDSNNPTQKKELVFYSELIGIFMQWFYDTMTEASSGTVWKQLVSLQETMEAKEMFGIERAFGSIYYIQGGFSGREDYLVFAESQDVANATLKAAREYSSDVEGVYQKIVTEEEQRVFEEVIRAYRYEIRNNPFPVNMTGSLELAKYWSDNMTLYVDAILDIQRVLTERIYDDLLETEKGDKLTLTVLGVVVGFTVAMCPVILNAVYSLTLEIQSYISQLVDRVKSLNSEKQRTDILHYQMLPRMVADLMKKGQRVKAELHQDVTIFVSNMVDFTDISARSSPTQVVKMLDNLHECFDELLQHYEVYKVENIGVSYTIASGLPVKLGKKHAGEIARMSLDIVEQIHNLEVPHMPGTRVQLKIGIHTGAEVAGVVGRRMPRYCLLGDTVMMAELLERTGMAGRIQISAATYHSLSEIGGYTMSKRKTDHDTMKGMASYWLLRFEGFSRSHSQSLTLGHEISDSGSETCRVPLGYQDEDD